MAEELRQTRIQKILISGPGLVRHTIQKEGTIEFAFIIKRPDGSQIKIPQQFTITPDLFARPRTVTVEAEPVAEAELIPELDHINSLIKSIRLPGKKKVLGGIKTDVGTYLYYLISSTELEKYLTIANRLEEIGQTITRHPPLQARLGNLYAEFITKLGAIEGTRAKLHGLEAKKAVRDRLIQLITAFVPRINQELLNEFRKQFSVDIRALRANIFVNNPEYLSWLMANADRIDDLLGVRGYDFNLGSLYRFINPLIRPTIDMYQQIEAISQTARKIRKVLAKPQ